MASIKCGNCKATHNSVAEVKACYTKNFAVAQIASDSHKKNVWDEVNAVASELPQLRKMHYAIFEQGPDAWHFYRVDIPNEGKWKGKIFVDAQASDEYWPIRDPQRVLGILRAIAISPEKAASDYGHQIGKCGICSRTLTKKISIDRGIGPICAQNAGW